MDERGCVSGAGGASASHPGDGAGLAPSLASLAGEGHGLG